MSLPPAKAHGLSSSVSQPRSTAPHVSGIAFDAVIIDDSGRQLNPMIGVVNLELLIIANACGFRNPPSNDGVHWQLA